MAINFPNTPALNDTYTFSEKVWTWNGFAWDLTTGGGNGGATGASGDHVFYENDTNVTASYTITAGKNAMSAGPITIDNGVTVTVPTGSVWTIV